MPTAFFLKTGHQGSTVNITGPELGQQEQVPPIHSTNHLQSGSHDKKSNPTFDQEKKSILKRET